MTGDEDMYGVRIVCIMCGHNKDLGKLPLKVTNVKEIVIAILENEKRLSQKMRSALYPPSLYG